MLLCNLDVKSGLCNGTWLIVVQMGRNVPSTRIDLTFSRGVPFTLRRIQFPVRLSFAMTLNKSLGQSFEKVGFSDPAFTHGQLYVALSKLEAN